MKIQLQTLLSGEPKIGRDIALRCLRPRSSGRNGSAAEHDSDGAARGPYQLASFQLQRGVALVITLILLAVITTLAIAFLALTYREGAAVDSLARTTDSELACESAQQRAHAEILAPFARNDTKRFSWATNGLETMGPDFMVSVAWDTNWWNPQGMITNPSPPVFVNTNRTGGPANAPFENRSYLDLNRNRHFEDTGYVQDTDDSFRPIPNQFNWRVGDPQWIGILQDPRRPHTNDNRFIARYAYLIQPIGRSLDVNWIHNDVKGNPLAPAPAPGTSGYFRNQGVGPFEINLAAFLCDLNSNVWNNSFNPYNAAPYNYLDLAASSTGSAFDDAWQLLAFRCYTNRTKFDTMTALFGAGVGTVIDRDDIDSYADGLLTGNQDNDDARRAWPGSDSKRHFFTPNDYFDRGKLGLKPAAGRDFVDRLLDASRLGNSDDRYTYYRMLAQMGTDSAEEEDGKVNINYVNIRSWVPNSTFRYRASDLMAWTNTTAQFVMDMGRRGPELFFLTVVTNLLLREPDLAFTVTNARPFAARNDPFGIPLRIPIFTNGSTASANLPLPGPLYAGRIHQILQLAANIHDATTGSKQGEDQPYFPSVFRPQFDDQRSRDGKVYITNYVLVSQPVEVTNPALWRDPDSEATLIGPNDLVYGIPLVIGARKGFPNFNEIAVMTTSEATRKLTVFRASALTDPDKIEQDLALKVRTRIQIEARNPWDRTNARLTQLVARLHLGMQVTNSPISLPDRVWDTTNVIYTYPIGRWPGETKDGGAKQTNSFVLTPVFETNVLDWAVRQNVLNSTTSLSTNFTATINNRMVFYILDSGRIVDFVTLNRPRNQFEIGKMMDADLPNENDGTLAKIWSSARDQAYNTLGIRNQVTISQNGYSVPNEIWGDYLGGDVQSKTDAAQKFAKFMADKEAGTNQAPFTPTRLIVQANYYQVDDPLVHYTFEDLRNDTTKEVYGTEPLKSARTNLNVSMGHPNTKALPWNRGDIGTPDGSTAIPGEGLLDPRLLDPGLIHPEYWDFPTNHFANIGWLGRVHRGTPWQSIYLKSRGPSTAADWKEHSGNQRHPNSANLMLPTRDWELLDIFTTAPHPNATRGRLSINQTNLAAWSAVLSGALTTEPVPHPDDPTYTAASSVPMQPAAISPAIQSIVAGINQQRTNVSSKRYTYNGTPYPFAPFNKLSDLLSTPELTEGSPFLNVDPTRFDGFKPGGTAIISDADYERIPQQILSLVKLGEPRFVVYAWGQSLKPARRNPEDTGPSIVTSGADQGLCRNYQITGEMATRAVIRIEFDRITDKFSPQYNQLDYSRPHAVVESFNILPVE